MRDTPFVGRERQLQTLNDAFDAVANGRAAAVSVHGPSGIGKSALVRRFLEPDRRARRRRRALRPLLRERVGALQGARRRGRRSEPPPRVASTPGRRAPPAARRAGADASVPRAAAGATPSPTRAGTREPGVRDPIELRRRAFDALRELLGRLAQPPVARRLHRRPAVGRRGQRRPARGAASASGRACHAHAVVLPQRGDRREAVPAGAARTGRP